MQIAVYIYVLHNYVNCITYIPFYQSQFLDYQKYQYVFPQDSSSLGQFVYL